MGLIVQTSNSEEIVNHLLLHCLVAEVLRGSIFDLSTFVGLCLERSSSFGSRAEKRSGKYLLCCLWRERNRRFFEGKELPSFKIKERFLNTVFL